MINHKIVDKEIIGDGIVLSSPFGADAYFKSITHTSFKRGIGIAFNNTTKKFNPVVVKEQSLISVFLLREKADLGFDNDPHIYTLHEGDKIEVKKSNNVALLIMIQ